VHRHPYDSSAMAACMARGAGCRGFGRWIKGADSPPHFSALHRQFPTDTPQRNVILSRHSGSRSPSPPRDNSNGKEGLFGRIYNSTPNRSPTRSNGPQALPLSGELEKMMEDLNKQVEKLRHENAILRAGWNRESWPRPVRKRRSVSPPLPTRPSASMEAPAVSLSVPEQERVSASIEAPPGFPRSPNRRLQARPRPSSLAGSASLPHLPPSDCTEDFRSSPNQTPATVLLHYAAQGRLKGMPESCHKTCRMSKENLKMEMSRNAPQVAGQMQPRSPQRSRLSTGRSKSPVSVSFDTGPASGIQMRNCLSR